MSPSYFAAENLLCALPDARTINHPRLYGAGAAGRILSDGTGFLMTQPSPCHRSLNPLFRKHPPPAYYHLSLTHSSPATGCYGNCNQEVHSLHNKWFVLEDKWFVERSRDGVMLRARLQHQTQVTRHFVLLQSFHLPLA